MVDWYEFEEAEQMGPTLLGINNMDISCSSGGNKRQSL
jgi:hypothetical protein